MGARETLRRREWTIAWVRWAAAALAAGQIALGGPVSLAPTVAGVAFLSVLGLVVAWADRALPTARQWRRLSAWLMGADSLAVLGLVAAGLSAGSDDLWVLLVLLALEGALRYRLRGAIGAAVGSGLVYVLLEQLVVGGISGSVLVSRLLFLLVVGVFAGAIARELDVERRLYQAMATAAQDIVARRDEASILEAFATHVTAALQADRSGVYRYSMTGWDEVADHRRPGVEVRMPMLVDDEDGISQILHRLTWRQGRGGSPGRLTLPLRMPERPAEYVAAVQLPGGRPTALAEGALMALAEATAVSLATRDLIRNQEASNRRLERLEALRTRFVATVAHDLRSPLTTVKGVARILRGRRDSVPAERVDAMLESVERQANRLNRLADDLLDAARLDSDQLELKIGPVSLPAVVRAVVEDAADEVEVLDCAEVEFLADGARLERVVWNLVSNALKYGRPPVQITGRVVGEEVRIVVRDHGKGLSPAQVERLFTDFAGGGDPDSVGLGLAIVWELVEAHGGSVAYVAADPGAAFEVRLPLREPGEDEGIEPPAASPR